MYILCLIAAVAAASDTVSHRRLIIDGGKATINEYPYIVALMFCKPTTHGVACASFCSGSLIATDVVLTAGHCVYDLTESAFGAPVSSVPLDNMFALVGSGDWKQLGGSRLIKVKQIVNRGYGQNLRYPFDDDVGLVFLSECVEPVPGRISTIPIEAASRVIRGNEEQCRPVTSLGFGRSANVPSEISVHDGVLRRLKGDFIHSHETCQAAYVEAHMKFSPIGVGEQQVYNESMLALDISPRKHICSGGNSIASTCFGDSGGPVVSVGGNSVVGVVSFGPLSECMISPDFAARVSTYANWILSQIEIFGKKCSPIESSFSTWPLLAEEELEEEPGRCSQWQCARSGECLSWAQVCDGNTDCNDGSDEDPYYCRVANRNRSKDSHGRSAAAFSDGVPAAWSPPIGIESEFAALVEKADRDVALFHGSGTVQGSGDGSDSALVSVVIIGVLDSVVRKARTGLGAAPRAEGRSAINSDLCRAIIPDAKSRFQQCTKKFQSAFRQMMEEIDYGYNRFEKNPDPVLNVCKDLSDCVFDNLTIPAKSWLDIVDTCSSERGIPSISSRFLGMAQFCGERLPYFMSLVAARQSYAETFLDRFGESQCIASLPERVDAADKDSRCHRTVTIVYILMMALIVFVY